MTPQTRLARVGALAISLVLLWSAAPPLLTLVSELGTAGSTGAVQLEDVRLGPDGSYTLAADAPPAPRAAGPYRRYGFALSPVYHYTTPFSQLQTSFLPLTPTDSAAQLDLRLSADGSRWSGWETDVTPGSTIRFSSSGRFAQYRVRLFGNANLPTIANVQIQPVRDTFARAAYAADEPLAPTYKVRATRQGMVGGRTANGYVIKKNDRFVSLPSWRALSSSRTNPEYFVRLSANGRSTVVPVMDVGPWNEHDDYWNESRERYRDLPRGYPQDHAAFYDNYNGRVAEKGWVQYPTAVDIGDGAFWDDLGLRGAQASVEITFLWLGRDPQGDAKAAEPAPAPAAASDGRVTVGTGDAGFAPYAKQEWYEKKGSCAASGRALWTYSAPTEADAENGARWTANLPPGSYDVQVFVPSCKNKAATGAAHYAINHADGRTEVKIDQGANIGKWITLGRFRFAESGTVELSDITGEEQRVVWFDAVRWLPAR